MAHKYIIILTLLLTSLGANRPPHARGDPDLNIPTASDILEEQGFDTTDVGLIEAMASKNRIAQLYAAIVANEKHNPIILNDASVFLQETEVTNTVGGVTHRYHLELARYLASFKHEEGFRKLREYASTNLDDPQKNSRGVIKASAILAELGDESYIYQIQRLLDQDNVGGIPLEIGSFHTTNNPAVERAWLTAAKIVKQRIQDGDTVSQRTITIDGKEHTFTTSQIRTSYIKPLYMAVAKQTIVTPSILAAFGDLAKLDHQASKRLRQDILKHWRTCELREAEK